MSKRAWLILALVCSVLLLVGLVCAGTVYLGFRAVTRVSGTSLSSQGDRLVEGRAAREQAGEGLFRLSGGLPPTLDPAMVQDSTSAEYVVHLFSGLVSLDERLEIVPDLASRWELSSDGRSYTFHLLPAATFQDGRPITAQDLVYSVERACSPDQGSPVAASYLEDIVGLRDYSQGKAPHILGLVVLDEHTLRIDIDAPKAYFLAKLTYPAAFVVDRQQIEGDPGWMRKPNGSGPFVLESASRDKIVLVRNDRYYGKRPALARVEYLIGGGLPMTMYENDQLDLVDVAASEIERVLDPDSPLHAEHLVSPELSVQYLGLNVSMPPFDDVTVRRAFARAIDREKLADLVLKNTAVPAVGILPRGMPDFDPSLVGLPYDPQQARELLGRSKYGAPGAMPKVALTIVGQSGHMDPVSRAIVAMIETNLGISMTVEQLDWPSFLRDMNERRCQLYSTGWIADYPDSQNFLDLLFHGDSPQNHMGYRNTQVDRLLEQARIEQDAAKRTALYREAERTIVDEAPWVPLTYGLSHILVKPNVEGYRPSGSIYPWLRDIRLRE